MPRRWQPLVDLWVRLLAVLDCGLASVATIHIVRRKRDCRAAIGWVGLGWLAPLFGVAAYFALGINRIQREAVFLKQRGNVE